MHAWTHQNLDQVPQWEPGFRLELVPINGTSSTPQTLESRSPVPLDIVIPGQDTGAPIGAGF